VHSSNRITTWIRPLCTHPSGPRLYCLYDHDFGDLADALSTEASFYGLGVNDLETADVDLSIQQLARAHLQDLRTTQPEGPYVLLGHSFGGLVAYEMAVQLKQSGASVALLALIDTSHPGFLATLSPEELEVALHVYRTDRVKKYLNNLKSGRIDRLITGALGYLGKKLRPLSWTAARTVRRAFGRDTPQRASRIVRVDAMWHAYVPPNLEDRLLLIRAQGRDAEFAGDPTMGWRKSALRGVDVQFATGSHEVMMADPHAIRLAQLLAPFVLALPGPTDDRRAG
jgi:thioesterase domain-containing protein